MKTVRMIVDVASDKVGDLIEAIRDMGGALAMGTFGTPGNGAAVEDDEPATVTRKVVTANKQMRAKLAASRTATPARQTVTGSRPGRYVVYTPVGTAKQIEKTLAALRPGSVSAFVLKDLAKHPGSQNADVRKRAERAKLNPESVDNAIWQLVNRGALKKSALAE